MFLTKAKSAIKTVATKISLSVKRTVKRKDKPQKLARISLISHNIDQLILETSAISESAPARTDGNVIPNTNVIDIPGVNASHIVNSNCNGDNGNCSANINSARGMDNSNCDGNGCNCNCNCNCNGNCNGSCACNEYDSDSDCDCSDCESICSGDYNPYSYGNDFFSADSDFFSDIICSGGYGFYSGGFSDIFCSIDHIIFNGGNYIEGEVFSEIYSESEYTDSICSGGNDICGNSATNTTATISATSIFKTLAKRAFKSKGKSKVDSDSATDGVSNTIKSSIGRVCAFSGKFIERAYGRSRAFFWRTRERDRN
ncbi:hypothetical protein IW137_003081 [Coemansia sp. RSA 1287]|nr:hypothetical protein GGH15_004428 [Coemansia sp. RSA 562]KAJ2641448.1 hypothetical protein IW137_003081 [Coemansia sp. RSA 1287]